MWLRTDPEIHVEGRQPTQSVRLSLTGLFALQELLLFIDNNLCRTNPACRPGFWRGAAEIAEIQETKIERGPQMPRGPDPQLTRE
jgi:hypothetical protein